MSLIGAAAVVLFLTDGNETRRRLAAESRPRYGILAPVYLSVPSRLILLRSENLQLVESP